MKSHAAKNSEYTSDCVKFHLTLKLFLLLAVSVVTFVHYLSNKLYNLHKVVHGSFPWNNSTGVSRKERISDASQPARRKCRNVMKEGDVAHCSTRSLQE